MSRLTRPALQPKGLFLVLTWRAMFQRGADHRLRALAWMRTWNFLSRCCPVGALAVLIEPRQALICPVPNLRVLLVQFPPSLRAAVESSLLAGVLVVFFDPVSCPWRDGPLLDDESRFSGGCYALVASGTIGIATWIRHGASPPPMGEADRHRGSVSERTSMMTCVMIDIRPQVV